MFFMSVSPWHSNRQRGYQRVSQAEVFRGYLEHFLVISVPVDTAIARNFIAFATVFQIVRQSPSMVVFVCRIKHRFPG